MAATSRGVARAEDLAAVGSGIIVVFTMFLVSADVAGRYVFGSPIPGVYETVERISLVAIVWLSVARTHRLGGHVSFSYLRNKLTGRRVGLLRVIPVLLSAGVWSIVAVTAVVVGVQQFGFVIRTTVVPIPLGIPFLIVATGSALLAIRTLLELSGTSPDRPEARSSDG